MISSGKLVIFKIKSKYVFFFQICQGGTVPKEYYLQNSDNLSQMQSATVPRGEKLYLEYKVDKPGSVIRLGQIN